MVLSAEHVLFMGAYAKHHVENSLHEIFIYVKSRQHLFYQLADSIYALLIEPTSRRLKALSWREDETYCITSAYNFTRFFLVCVCVYLFPGIRGGKVAHDCFYSDIARTG